MRATYAVTAAGILGVLAATRLPARADDCAAIMSGMFAQAKMPYASDSTTSQTGRPPTHVKMVVSGGKMYIQAMGAWQSVPYSSQEVIDKVTQNQKTTKQTCRKIGAEAVNGEAAALYTEHEDNNGKIVDSRVWISDSGGLPLKLEIRFGGLPITQTSEFRYDNVQPPAGVK